MLKQIFWNNIEPCISATPLFTEIHYNLPHQVIYIVRFTIQVKSEGTNLQTMLLTPSSCWYLKYITRLSTGVLLWFSLQGRDANA